MRAGAATPLADVLEKDLQANVFELALLLGWKKTYHVYDSRRSHSGFPDCVLVRDRVVYLELKREKTRCSPAQKQWLRALMVAGAEVYVIRPRNVDALVRVLGSRGRSPSGVLASPHRNQRGGDPLDRGRVRRARGGALKGGRRLT